MGTLTISQKTFADELVKKFCARAGDAEVDISYLII